MQTAKNAAAALPSIALAEPGGSQVRVYAHGAQVMSWVAGGRERLFTSPLAVFRPGKPIRGGVPVIFPQFGQRGPGLRHGFARLLAWTPVTRDATPGRAILTLRDSAESRQWWPHRFRAELCVQLSASGLSISLAITNDDPADFTFTAALHSYLRVTDLEHAALTGLQDQPYVDAADGDRRVAPSGATLRITGEVDRVYTGSGGHELVLQDAGDALRIRAEGFTDTVIWNPGPALAAGLADLGAGNHRQFICVEAASAETPVRLAPGQTWRGTQAFSLD